MAFWLVPIVASIVLSGSEYWDIITPPAWIGFDNYRDLVDDRNFWVSIRVTLKYVALSVPLYLILGLLLSLLLNLKLRGMNVFRTILFVPSVLSGVAVAVLWVALLNPDTGAVNGVLRSIGIDDPPRWLASPTWAVPSVVLIGLWGIGGGAIIYLAGLQNIAAQLYEAALLDGAGAWQRFRYVTLPMLTPTLLFVLLTGLIDAFQIFDTAYVEWWPVRSGGRLTQLLSAEHVERSVREPQLRLRIRVGVDPRSGLNRRDRRHLPDVESLGVLRVRPGAGALVGDGGDPFHAAVAARESTEPTPASA